MTSKLQILCKKCGAVVVDEDSLCLYKADDTASFLIIKPEISLPPQMVEYPSTSKNKYIVAHLHCVQCKSKIGNRIPKGPSEAKFYNFALCSEDIVIPNFSLKDKKKPIDLLPTFKNLQQRDWNTFLGAKVAPTISFNAVQTIFPTIKN